MRDGPVNKQVTAVRPTERGKIPINGVAFGSGRPSVFMGGTPLIVNDGFNNTYIVANLSSPGE